MRTIIAAAVVLLSGPAMAASCVNATIKDANDVQIQTPAPLVAFIFPEVGPVVDYTIPAGARLIETGTIMEANEETNTATLKRQYVPCPESLLARMNQIFKESCLTDKARGITAKNNSNDDEIVNKRCRDLYKELNPK